METGCPAGQPAVLKTTVKPCMLTSFYCIIVRCMKQHFFFVRGREGGGGGEWRSLVAETAFPVHLMLTSEKQEN